MYSRHESATVVVSASAAQVFDLLDDHQRLSAHMSKRSLMMGGGKMTTVLDGTHGKAVGSVIEIRGRVFGLLLWLKEIVVERERPARKVWETIGAPRLLVVGAYRMGFRVSGNHPAMLTVWIDYELPTSGTSKLLGKWFGRAYARWCVRRMTNDAAKASSLPVSEQTLQHTGNSPTGAAPAGG